MTPLDSRTRLGQAISMAAAVALLLSMVAGLHAVAGDDAATPGDPSASHIAAPKLSTDDQKFVETALKGGIAEIQEVQLAQKKAANPELRTAAAQLEQEHQALNTKLSGIGSKYGVALPEQPSPERKALYEKLQKLSGAEFDARFLEAGTQAHQKTITLFERTQSTSSNPDIKALAGDTLPTLRKHLSMLQDLQAHKKTEKHSSGS